MSKTVKRRPRSKDQAPSFEQNLEKLQQIIRDLEEGELDLAASLQHYEDGVQRLKQCYQQLNQAERRVELLSGQSADGQPTAEAFDEEAMSLEEKAEARSDRRTRRSRSRIEPKPPDHVDDSPGLF